MGALLGIFVILLVIALVVGILAFWIWMLVDAIKNPKLDTNWRLIWVIVIIFAHLLGAIIYYFAGKNPAPTPKA